VSKTVIWIRPAAAASAALDKALGAQGLALVALDGPEDLAGLAQDPDLAALLVDSDYLEAAARFRDDHKELRDRELPLLVLSRRSDLVTRLEALRQGACAFFTPPLDETAVVDKLAEVTGLAGGGRPYRVMVVDDDPVQASLAAAILRKADIAVCTVTESLQVLETLRSYQPDLILMDVYMPDASGLELTSIIRSQRELIHIPIVYLSAEHDPDKQLDALSAGGEDFLTKPIRPKHLVATVRNRIDRARQLREGAAGPRRTDADPALARKHVLELLERIHSTPSQGQSTGLLYLEIDNPIPLLEQVKLQGMDEIMSKISKSARALTRPGDRVSRFGDLCLVIIAQRKAEAELVRLARDIRKAADGRRFSIAGHEVSTGVSIGLRLLEEHDRDANQLISEAIQTCHRARAATGGGIEVQHGEPPTTKTESALDSYLLKQVMNPDNLQVVYQPIVPLQGDREALYQCLLRLRAPDGGVLSAAEFLPTVEQTGKILKLDRWVIYKAVVMLHKLRRVGGPQPLRLFVSQSASALRDLERIRWLIQTLAKSRIPPHGLVLEFRFPEIAADLAGARDYLSSLRRIGIGISLNSARELDDLKQHLDLLPADYLKITESQIRNYPDTWGELVRQAHQGGMRMVVSRIEHPELLGQLWANEVDYIQGNFIQQPGEDLTYDFTGAVLG
jgi:diguanylate cyclase (GGDEF)-like protein